MKQHYAVDSRAIREGDIFFALPGAKSDGHAHLQEVASKGAIGAYVRKSYEGPSFGMTLYPVEDVLLTLQEMARQAVHCIVIGITGSVGKTTTKEFLAHLLEGKFNVAKNWGNANSQISLPLTILNEVEPDTEVLVLEMGMSEPGNIEKLVEIAPPQIAILTGVGLVHAANFENLEAIAREKCAIFSHLKTVRAILPAKWFSFIPKNMIPTEISELPLPPLPFSGKHFRHNLLAAAAAALEMGMTIEEIAQRVPTLQLPKKRCEWIEKKGVIFINDCYNASAESTIAALDLLSESAGRRVAVLGSMLELGAFSEEEHRRVGKHSLQCADLLFCFGKEGRMIGEVWKEAGRSFEWAEDRRELEEMLQQLLQEGDRVLVKGSNSLKMWELIDRYDGSCRVLC